MERLADLYPELYQGGSTNQQTADFGKKWGWYQNFYQLAGGNIFRFKAVGELRLHEALLFLSYETDKNKLEMRLLKQKK